MAMTPGVAMQQVHIWPKRKHFPHSEADFRIRLCREKRMPGSATISIMADDPGCDEHDARCGHVSSLHPLPNTNEFEMHRSDVKTSRRTSLCGKFFPLEVLPVRAR